MTNSVTNSATNSVTSSMQHSYANLQLEIREHVALLTLNNPPAHTWTVESLASLTQLVTDLNQRPEVSALVITGSGEKFFSAGADLKLFANGDKALARTMASSFGRAFEALAAFRGVSIAAINGYAMGGGLECALACDLRIAEEHAQMALPEASVGLLPCAGGTQLLAHLVGEAWAKRLILCGERLNAQQALGIGLVEQVVAKGASLQAALELADKVTQQSPDSVVASKKLIQASRHMPLQQALVLERESFVDLFDGANQSEGVQAFFGKRAARWNYA